VDDAGRGARFVAVGLLTALVTCAAMGSDGWWPLTAWQLFSRVRTADQAGWEATAVIGGAERPIPFGDLPRSFHGAQPLLQELPHLSVADVAGVCAAWSAGMATIGPRPDTIRIYKTNTHFTLDGEPAVTTRTFLAFEC
jgi:hypothetical protein